MSDHRNWGSTVLGWFIERDEASPATVERESPASEPPAESMPSVFASEPPAAPGGQVDFEGVFDAAGIDREERSRVARAGELLASLPADTPVAARKQIVEASLKAFGVPIDKIIETGVEEIQALEAYIRGGAADTQKLLEESTQRIRQYEDEIKNIRRVQEQRVQEQQAAAAACNARKLEVQHVLEFFGQETVARVVRDSPKLYDPSAPGQTTT